MRICEIEFPEPLLASQKDCSLVVFAGAGVSIPPPSSYPNFKELANRVAGGVLTLEPGEPIDRFLGRLADRGTYVHRIVGEILTDPKSKPNGLHLDLLRLFSSGDALRLVTTNFDSHFSTAAPLVFAGDTRYEIYYAPALPPGDSFSGLVYLHGGVEKPFERLILTDSDFGRAYLTEGWARTFLQKLFERYTVLFVGYSHSDPIMNYLARGLPPARGMRKRFALTAPGQEESWKYLGIIPITYKLAVDDNPHSALPKAISAWAKQVRLGVLEQEQRIKNIVELPPPIDPEDADYIEVALSELATTRFFTRHAQTVPWLKWVEEKKLLKRLFDPHAAPTELDGELGQWFVQRFLCESVGESLSVLRRQGGRLSPLLWTAIAWRLGRNAPERPSSEALHRWLAVLLNYRPPGTNADFLEHVAPNLVFPDDTVPALLLFEYLSRPTFRLENDFWSEVQGVSGGEEVKFKVATTGGGFWLNHLWTRFFAPNLAVLVDKLEPTVTSHLQQAYLLSHADGETDPSWDALSFSRSTIESADHVDSRDGFGVLVDAGFAIMQRNVQHQPSRSDALIDLWFAADSLLLKRLAIIGVSLSTHWAGDRKLEWLLSNDLLYRPFLKHEVFELLKGTYPRLSTESRKVLLDQARRGPKQVPEGHEATAAYETYNLLYWLKQSDPRCALAKSAFDDLQVAHPEFGQREHPDLDVVSSGWTWGGEQSPKTVEDLLSKRPEEQIEYLLSFKSETPFGPSREGLLETVNEAAVREYEWGRQLATELQSRGAWDTDLWSSILRGWTRADFSNDQWKGVLAFLSEQQKLHDTSVNEITRLLREGVKKGSKPIPDSCLRVAVDLSKKLWAALIAKGDQRPKERGDPDWVARAINHPAGEIALFWLSWLVRERKQAGTSWQGIPEDIREVLEAITIEHTYAGELGCVVLASQLSLLSSADELWTKSHVLPLFDWSVDSKRALQAYHGFLTWGRQTESLVPYLVTAHEKMFAHLPELGRLRGRFTEYLAGIAFATSTNPFVHGWLNRFATEAAREDRIAWASYVRQLLRGFVNEARTLAWVSWIKPYWKQRILGVPIPLDGEELGEMVEWALHLGPSFPEVVEVVCASPGFELRHSFLFGELAETELPQQYPIPVANLLLTVLKNTQNVVYDLDKVEGTVRLIAPLHAPMNTLRGICNELARLGYPPAAALDAWLQDGGFCG